MENEVMEVIAAFNPFAVLSTEESNNELVALAGRFNKAWKSQRKERIVEITVKHGCSAIEACFVIWLQDDARAILSRERIKKSADAIVSIIDEVLGESKAHALKNIEFIYSEVPEIDRPDVGKKIRKDVHAAYTLKISARILEIVYAHLGVKEHEWM